MLFIDDVDDVGGGGGGVVLMKVVVNDYRQNKIRLLLSNNPSNNHFMECILLCFHVFFRLVVLLMNYANKMVITKCDWEIYKGFNVYTFSLFLVSYPHKTQMYDLPIIMVQLYFTL